MLRRIFPGQSAAATRLRGHDWSWLAPPASWPVNVRTAISLCLTSVQPMVVCWRDVPFANDAWGQELDPQLGMPAELEGVVTPLFADRVWIEAAPARLRDGVLASPLFDDAGELAGIVIVRDVAARLAHRLREPLGPVLMTIDVLKRRAPSPEVDVLDEQVRRLAGVVSEVAPPRAAARTAPGRSRRILIVEDDDATARALATALEDLGHTVALAHDGPVALVVARELQPELVLLDIGLPVLNGWDLAARLREVAQPRMIAVTGFDGAEAVQRSGEAGIRAHLVKPVDLDQLVRAMDDAD